MTFPDDLWRRLSDSGQEALVVAAEMLVGRYDGEITLVCTKGGVRDFNYTGRREIGRGGRDAGPRRRRPHDG